MIAGSDSGRIVILQYSKEKNCFTRIHQETFGKSGCRCGAAPGLVLVLGALVCFTTPLHS